MNQAACGFTLVELMVAMVAAAILLGAVVRLILASYQVWFGNGGVTWRYQEVLGTFEELGGEIRSASAVLSSSNQQQLVMDTRSGLIRYWFAGNTLWRQKAGESPRVLLTELESGRFSYWEEKRGEQASPPSGSFTVRISVSWRGGSLETGFCVREWG